MGVSLAGIKAIRIPFRAQLLICQIGGIVLSGFAVNCLSMERRPGVHLTWVEAYDWLISGLLPALWGFYGTARLVKYGDFLTSKRAESDHWSMVRSTWHMLTLAVPQVILESVDPEARKRAVAELTSHSRINEIRGFKAEATKMVKLKEAELIEKHPGSAFFVPGAALLVALVIRWLWSYNLI